MAKRLYTNTQEFQHGLHITNPAPLDDRTVWIGLDTLYIDAEYPQGAPLYNRVYKGMSIIVFDEVEKPIAKNAVDDASDVKVYTYILKDDTPYLPGSNITINKRNIKEYWTETNQEIADAITGDLAPAIDDIHKYLNDNIITVKKDADGKECGGVTITSKEHNGDFGNVYDIVINTDDSHIKVVDNKLSVGDYIIRRSLDSLPNDIFATYVSAYRAPGATEYVDIPGSEINLPKNYFIKESHQCKATRDADGKYITHLIFTDEVTDEEWDQAEGDIYLHYIWNTSKDLDDNAPVNESWIKVSDVIKIDINNIEKKITDINASIAEIKTGATLLANQFISKTGEIDASIVAINDSIDELSTSINERIDEVEETLEESIRSTNATLLSKIDEGDTSLATAVANLNTSINKTLSDIETSIDDLSTGVYDKIDDLSTNVDKNIEDINDSISDIINVSLANVDASMVEIFDIVLEDERISTEALLDINGRLEDLAKQIKSLEATVSKIKL